MAQLGGTSIFLSASDGRPGRARERRRLRPHHQPVRRCRGRCGPSRTPPSRSSPRTRACPVINGLSDLCHPCQALADLLTIQEAFGELRGPDAGVRRRRQQRGPVAGRRLRQARACASSWPRPQGYGFDDRLPADVPPRRAARRADRRTATRATPSTTADVIYTDVWTSMGQEAETRAAAAASSPPFQVNAALLAQAPAHATVMHCLPAHRGEEVDRRRARRPAASSSSRPATACTPRRRC